MRSNTHDVRSPRVNQQTLEPRITHNIEDVIEIINDQEKHNFKLGVFYLVIAISTWMIGLQLVNNVLKGNEYDKPIFLSMVTGSCFMLNLLPECGQWLKSFFTNGRDVDECKIDPPNETTPLALESSNQPPIFQNKPEELTSKEISILAIQISLIYMLYNVCGMSSLQFTSASNQTVLGSTTTMFTLFMGVMLKIDNLTLKKTFCVAVSLLGVIFINLSQHQPDSSDDDPDDHNKFDPKNPLLGNTLALFAAFFYAVYLIIMKVKCGTGDKTTNERRLFGLVGVFTFLFGIPITMFVHFVGIEKFEFPPPSNKILIMLLINSFFSYISDFTTILALLLTSPLVTSLSLTSSIPITIFMDYLIIRITGGNSYSSSNLYIYTTGILSILTSVILINVNIANENEYIGEVIEDALQSAIHNDEVLSPLLTPLLSSPSYNIANSPSHLSVGFNHLASPRFYQKQSKKSTPVAGSNEPQLSRKISGFNLNSLNDNANPISSHDPSDELLHTDLLVYGGVNHQYHIIQADKSSNNTPEVAPMSP